MSELGLLQVYTGDGKGKTTAALGLSLRAVGHGLHVLFLQFLKNDETYGECLAKGLLPHFDLIPVGRDAFVDFKNPDPMDIELVRKGWEKAVKAIASRSYDLVVLDELTLAIAFDLLPLDTVISFLELPHEGTEVVITGRYAPDELLDLADLVTEMKEIKHYFRQGTDSRDGIDH